MVFLLNLLHLFEMNARVGSGDLLVDDSGLLHPLVAAGQRDGLAVGLVVAELGEGGELGLERWFMVIAGVGGHG